RSADVMAVEAALLLLVGPRDELLLDQRERMRADLRGVGLVDDLELVPDVHGLRRHEVRWVLLALTAHVDPPDDRLCGVGRGPAARRREARDAEDSPRGAYRGD